MTAAAWNTLSFSISIHASSQPRWDSTCTSVASWVEETPDVEDTREVRLLRQLTLEAESMCFRTVSSFALALMGIVEPDFRGYFDAGSQGAGCDVSLIGVVGLKETKETCCTPFGLNILNYRDAMYQGLTLRDGLEHSSTSTGLGKSAHGDGLHTGCAHILKPT
jgi:hypothetical protein